MLTGILHRPSRIATHAVVRSRSAGRRSGRYRTAGGNEPPENPRGASRLLCEERSTKGGDRFRVGCAAPHPRTRAKISGSVRHRGRPATDDARVGGRGRFFADDAPPNCGRGPRFAGHRRVRRERSTVRLVPPQDSRCESRDGGPRTVPKGGRARVSWYVPKGRRDARPAKTGCYNQEFRNGTLRGP